MNTQKSVMFDLSPPLLALVLAISGCAHPSASLTRAGPAAEGASTVTSATASPSATTLPYRLELVEVSGSNLPALHSFASASVGRHWLLIGGRTAGLHGLGSGKGNFPRSSANTQAFVVDPEANALVGAVDLVQALNPALASQLTATNPEFVQVGTDLYVVGGYGQDLTSGTLTTFGSVVKIDVTGLIDAIINKKPIAQFFQQSPRPENRLKVTGGELKYLGGVFYLVFGQDFTGFYSIDNGDYNRAGGQFQEYTEKVRVFTLKEDLSIDGFNQIDGGYDSDLPYHRRDLNVVSTVLADGATPDATVYGGVFKAGQMAGHVAPITLGLGTTQSTTVSKQQGFSQGLSHYNCATLTLFDAASRSCFTTFFGGISQYHYDRDSNTLILDALNLDIGVDGLPFIDTVSTIQRTPQGDGFSFTQTISETPLPALLGADAHFLPSAQLNQGQLLANGVLSLASLSGKTLVGYVYGGIESFGPYSSLVKTAPTTQASSRLFQVFVTPAATPVTPLPPLPSTATPYPVDMKSP